MKDITGQRSGRLTALSPSHKDKYNNWWWHCKCDCGVIKAVKGAAVVSGKTRSCGCLVDELRRHKWAHTKIVIRQKTINLYVGKKYGRLLVQELLRDEVGGILYAGCQCDCGGTALVSLSGLQKGHTVSCGCLTIERQRNARIKGIITSILKVKSPIIPKTKPPYRPHNNIPIKHKYDNVEIDGGRVFNHAAVVLGKNLKGVKSHLYYCQCGCGQMCLCNGHNLSNGRLNCPDCIREHKRKAAAMGNESIKRKDKASRKRKRCNRRDYERRGRRDMETTRRQALLKHHQCCHVCGIAHKDIKNMHVHHLRSYSNYPKYAYTLSNTVLLCKECHEGFHKEYGLYDFTPLQYWSFKTAYRDTRV